MYETGANVGIGYGRCTGGCARCNYSGHSPRSCFVFGSRHAKIDFLQ